MQYARHDTLKSNFDVKALGNERVPLTGLVRMSANETVRSAAGLSQNAGICGICTLFAYDPSRKEAFLNRDFLIFSGMYKELKKNYYGEPHLNLAQYVDKRRILQGGLRDPRLDISQENYFLIPYAQLNLAPRQQGLVGQTLDALENDLPGIITDLEYTVVEQSKPHSVNAFKRAFAPFPASFRDQAAATGGFYRTSTHAKHSLKQEVEIPVRVVKHPFGRLSDWAKGYMRKRPL